MNEYEQSVIRAAVWIDRFLINSFLIRWIVPSACWENWRGAINRYNEIMRD